MTAAAGFVIDSLEPGAKGRKGPGQAVAVRDLALPAGEVVALVGPNGSGKSTIIEAALGLRPDYRVQARLDGHANSALPPGERVKLGAALQSADFAEGASVGDIRQLHRWLYGGDDAGLDGPLGVGALARQRFHRLSGGQKQRVRLYYALAHRPAVALLDEPEAALDAAYRDALARHFAQRRAAGQATLVASHDPDIIAGADRLGVLQAGRFVAWDSPAAVCKALVGAYVVELAFDSEAACARAAAELDRRSDVTFRHVRGAELYAGGGDGLPGWVDALKTREALPVQTIKQARPSELAKVLSRGQNG